MEVGGKTRINSVFGEYTIENTQITFKSFGGTYAGEIGWGSKFVNDIHKVNSFEIKSDLLTLQEAIGTIKMIFIRTEKFDQWKK